MNASYAIGEDVLRLQKSPVQVGTVSSHGKNEYGHREMIVDCYGRKIRSVKPLGDALGLRSGRLPRLPPIGSYGIVVFPDSGVNSEIAYWIGSIEIDAEGPHVEDSNADQRLHSSGEGSLITAQGETLHRDFNGDVEWAGLSEALPMIELRSPQGERVAAPTFRRGLYRIWDWSLTRSWSVSLASTCGLILNAAKRKVSLFIGKSRIDLEDGRARVIAEITEIGPDPGLTSFVAMSGPSYINDKNLADKIAKIETALQLVAAPLALTAAITPILGLELGEIPLGATFPGVKIIKPASKTLKAE